MTDKLFFDPAQGKLVPGLHVDAGLAPVRAQTKDPSHIKRPALFLQIGMTRVTGAANGNVEFSGSGPQTITRAAMRDLIDLFQQWDSEADL